MSKMNGLRAMREARYERSLTQATLRGDTPAPAARPAAQPAPDREKEPELSPTGDAPLCGHRAISGRTCTREMNHEAKSHRYS
jgi:hypothetical protein